MTTMFNLKSGPLRQLSQRATRKVADTIRKPTVILGSLQIVFGTLSVIFQVVGIVLGKSHAGGVGIVCGLLFVVAGGLSIGASKSIGKCLAMTTMIMSIAAAVFTIFQLAGVSVNLYFLKALTTKHAGWEDSCSQDTVHTYQCFSDPPSDVDPCIYRGNGTCEADPHVTESYSVVCKAKKVKLECKEGIPHYVILFILMALGFAEMIVSILQSIFCCRAIILKRRALNLATLTDPRQLLLRDDATPMLVMNSEAQLQNLAAVYRLPGGKTAVVFGPDPIGLDGVKTVDLERDPFAATTAKNGTEKEDEVALIHSMVPGGVRKLESKIPDDIMRVKNMTLSAAQEKIPFFNKSEKDEIDEENNQALKSTILDIRQAAQNQQEKKTADVKKPEIPKKPSKFLKNTLVDIQRAKQAQSTELLSETNGAKDMERKVPPIPMERSKSLNRVTSGKNVARTTSQASDSEQRKLIDGGEKSAENGDKEGNVGVSNGDKNEKIKVSDGDEEENQKVVIGGNDTEPLV